METTSLPSPKAWIYKQAKTTMQSGKANTSFWKIEFERQGKKFLDPMTGWTGNTDMEEEINLRFPTLEAAIRYAENQSLNYEVILPNLPQVTPKSYAANFK